MYEETYLIDNGTGKASSRNNNGGKTFKAPCAQLGIRNAELVQRLGTTVGDDEGERDALSYVGVTIAVAVHPDPVRSCTRTKGGVVLAC